MKKISLHILFLCLLQSCLSEDTSKQTVNLSQSPTQIIIDTTATLQKKDTLKLEMDSLSITIKKAKAEKKIISAENKVLLEQIHLKLKNNLKVKVLIVPCSNCYTCGTKGYEINPIVEKVLAKLPDNIEIETFSFKKMCKEGCHGVYDKKHAKGILKNTQADFLIMTKIEGKCTPYRKNKNSIPIFPNTGVHKWGYGIKILNTKTLVQKKPLYAKDLKYYESIENHLIKNIHTLLEGMEAIHK